MQTNGKDIYINIKELPLINTVQPGDFFILETTQGTNIIDFSNVIIPPENTTFYNEIEQLQADVSALSTLAALQRALLISVSGVLDTKINSVCAQMITLIDQVSSNLEQKAYLITGGGTWPGITQSFTTLPGARSQLIRNDIGNYTITFNTPFIACNITTDADFTYIDKIDQINGFVQFFTSELTYNFDISGGSTAFSPITAIDYVLEKNPVDPTIISVVAF